MERSTDDARTATEETAEEPEEAFAVPEAAPEEAPSDSQEAATPEDEPAGEAEAETVSAGISELTVPDEPLAEETAEPAVADEPPVEKEPAKEAAPGHGGPLGESAGVQETELAVELPSEDVAPAGPEMDLPVEAGEEARDEMADAAVEPAVQAAEPPAAVDEPAAEAAPKPAAAEPEDAEEPAERARDPFRGPGDWYVVHTYAGYENKVKANLASRINSMQMQDKIFDVHIPMEDVMEIKGGKKQVVQKKVFPGYLLVKMVYDNDSWYVVRNTPGVTGFVSSGTGTKPTPLSRREVEKILAVKAEAAQKAPRYRLEFEEGDTVRIIAGPFADFNGTISEINLDQSKLKVLVNIFDRDTPVELGFDQVTKV
jgi:transcriptional antiterminator NusG